MTDPATRYCAIIDSVLDYDAASATTRTTHADLIIAYIKQNQFAPGSMLPKVEAAIQFAESRMGRQALITLLEKAKDGIAGETGTTIHL